ncbi:MAG TPA: 3-oxoacyl-[acyl-carrier-protein] synthase III C-terminal domain-containing protein [Candidatus Kapabacteria bacterium]|nr:3-oxoacyl-[acyl-carrier-protein] synthase III C-terminal domain-containing protein [Candidatus Kapabacteria bacterium]
MSLDVYVHDFALSLGDHEYSLEESVAAGRTHTGTQALAEAGFRRHRVCRAEQSAYDLARAAVTPIAGAAEGAGAIIYATCLPLNGNIGDEARFRETRDVKHLMDFPVSHLQADFHLDRAAAIGLGQQACTSMLGSMRLARALLRDEPELGRILCVSADRFPPGAEHEQAYNLISDGGAACIVSREARGYRFLGAHHITNGAMATANDEETAGFYFSYSHRMITELCRKAGITPADVQWIVPQNTNRKAWRILSSVLRFDFQRILMPTIGTAGHCISGDNIINLKTVQAEGRIQPGDKILLPMAGFGLNWSCILLEKVAD